MQDVMIINLFGGGAVNNKHSALCSCPAAIPAYVL